MPYGNVCQNDADTNLLQAWGQATRADGTLIVLHSGNHELVCIRHRASQTLYVSEVIEPHKCSEPGYGEILAGIYVAAVQDAVDRMQQELPPVSQSSSPVSQLSRLPDDGGDKDQGSGSKRRGSPELGHHEGRSKRVRGMETRGGLQGSAGGEGLTDDELEVCNPCVDSNVNHLPKPDEHQKMIHEANIRDAVLIYLQYGVYDSPVPASFLRSAPSIMTHTTPPFSPRPIHSYKPEECLAIVLTSEIERGATGVVVHHGTLMLPIWDDDDETPIMDVVVKLAFSVEQREAIRNEYEIYRRLRLKGIHRGIVTTLGLFDDSEGDACALVMLHGGVPLPTDLQGNLTCNLSISDW